MVAGGEESGVNMAYHTLDCAWFGNGGENIARLDTLDNTVLDFVFNARVNARGDELGAGGKILRKREDVMAEYYENNPKAKPEIIAPVATKEKK